VYGMWSMLQQDVADDYVLATGKTYTVRHFIELAAKMIGMNIQWEGYGVDEKGRDLNSGKIIIEIDEKYYIDYDCTCENKRIMELSQDVGHKPIVFIRFNPDDYLEGENNITSCWGIGKDGICRIKKNKIKEWDNRMNILKEQINYWIQPENTTNKTVEIIQLFYDK